MVQFLSVNVTLDMVLCWKLAFFIKPCVFSFCCGNKICKHSWVHANVVTWPSCIWTSCNVAGERPFLWWFGCLAAVRVQWSWIIIAAKGLGPWHVLWVIHAIATFLFYQSSPGTALYTITCGSFSLKHFESCIPWNWEVVVSELLLILFLQHWPPWHCLGSF